jgi:hypothetical protein
MRFRAIEPWGFYIVMRLVVPGTRQFAVAEPRSSAYGYGC